MGDIVKAPMTYRHQSRVMAGEIWAQDEPPSEMVWEVCPYLRGHLDDSRCAHCPRWERDEQYGQVQRGCYGIAAEACRIVFAMRPQDGLSVARARRSLNRDISDAGAVLADAERNDDADLQASYATIIEALKRARDAMQPQSN